MSDTPPIIPDLPPTGDTHDRPHINIVPPKLAGIFLLVGIFASFIVPLRLFDYWTAFFAGFFLACSGGSLVVWAFQEFATKGTNFRIDRSATVIVTSGPYSFTRNPIYLGGAIAYAGIAMMFNAGWALLLLIPLVIIIHRQVILPEETYLESKFGPPYMAYKQKVNRWL